MIFRQDVSKLGDPATSPESSLWFFATFGWGAGSILSKRWGSDKNPMFDSGMQLFFRRTVPVDYVTAGRQL
jgi:hypothetical protein